jgi:TRAP-type C4-dicarboxylate transport system permease large subunit
MFEKVVKGNFKAFIIVEVVVLVTPVKRPTNCSGNTSRATDNTTIIGIATLPNIRKPLSICSFVGPCIEGSVIEGIFIAGILPGIVFIESGLAVRYAKTKRKKHDITKKSRDIP